MRSRWTLSSGVFLFVVLFGLGAFAQGAAPQNGQTAANPAPTEAAPGKQPVQPAKKKYDPRDVCITEEDASSELLNKRRQIGGRIIMDTFLLPTGGTVDVGLDEPFAEGDYYFGALDIGTASPVILDRTDVRIRQAADTDTLIKKGLMRKDRTIVNLRFPDVIDAPWKQAQLYIFTCQGGSPFKVSETTVRVSPAIYSSGLAWLSVILGYLIAAFAFRTSCPPRWYGYLDPIAMSAGADGRASLGKLQIVMFSLIVFGLITYFLLRTGVLTDISSTVLLLLGIAGVGSTVAKGADNSRTTLSPENKAWLLRKQWLSSTFNPNNIDAHWRDLFTTDGEFDVYRYQSFIFSLVVAGALIIGGVTQLSSFEIPQTLLGILGLSQVVYIGGKLVTPTSMADLNKSIDDLRQAEKKFRASAITANNGILPANLQLAVVPASQTAYDDYMSLATDVATLYTTQTNIPVAPDKLQPTL
ncbi:hypothetical protein N2603_42500 [Bradyrhizobium huanghuaihaiense]|uniref:hypothetical protein n=1 Tax=Bradyrhizobium huanghuaihaiense TaxID=990078 RepID=UPI0021AAB6BD|nr:hypothetical protein [Bradyrhizobium sp. CB3035]UWU76473.1 hypothetical protein N2603_42500 [Bradyrhizobium sp. CB3035]